MKDPFESYRKGLKEIDKQYKASIAPAEADRVEANRLAREQYQEHKREGLQLLADALRDNEAIFWNTKIPARAEWARQRHELEQQNQTDWNTQ